MQCLCRVRAVWHPGWLRGSGSEHQGARTQGQPARWHLALCRSCKTNHEGRGEGQWGGEIKREMSVMMQQRSVHVPAAAAAAAATLESQHSIRQLQRKQQPLSQQQMLVQPRQELALPPRLALSATYSAIRVSSCAWWSLRSCVASVTMRTCVIHATSAPLQRAIEEGKKRERKKEGVEVKESALTSDTT